MNMKSKTGAFFATLLIVVMSAPVMASDSLRYKHAQKKGQHHVRGSSQLEHVYRSHQRRGHHVDRHKRDKKYDRHNRGHRKHSSYDRHRKGHRKYAHHDRHHARHSNRHTGHHYRHHGQQRHHKYRGHHRHDYRRYPSSYGLYYNISPYYSFGFKYYD